MRLLRRRLALSQTLDLLGEHGHQVSEAHLRPAAGPYRPKRSGNIEVPRVEYDKLSERRLGEPSECIRKRVEAAREKQRERFSQVSMDSSSSSKPENILYCNAEMGPAEVRQFCLLDETGRALTTDFAASLITDYTDCGSGFKY